MPRASSRPGQSSSRETPASAAKTSTSGVAFRRWLPGVAALLSVLALLAAAWQARRQYWPPIERAPRSNVLLITIDTLRADALGSSGNRRVETPWLDRLAATGVRFTRAYAHNVVTLPSHANILSGRYPFDHGVRENAGFRLPATIDTLATVLRAQGYKTAAFVSAFPLDSRFGLTRGFDVYDDAYGDTESHTAFQMQERAATDTVARAGRWLAEAGDGPLFCWVHVYDPHFPYAPPEPFATAFRDAPYEGEVSAVDAALAPLLRPALDAGDASRTLVIVTADHGEALGEHGEATHGLFAYESTLRVPLIIHHPRVARPRVETRVARHVDLFPTVLDALALPVPETLPGRSLLELLAGRRPTDLPTPSYFESLSASLNRGWAPLTGVVHGSDKYIELPVPELYDLDRDPGETSNLEATRPQRTRELQGLVTQFAAQGREVARSEETAAARAALASLGYVTGTAPQRQVYTREDDPKTLVALDARVHEIVTHYQQNDLDRALALCEAVVRERPTMSLTWLYLAFLRSERGEARLAVDAARQALALNVADEGVAALLGVYLVEAGESDEALRVLEPYTTVAEPDLDILMALGVALAAEERFTDASSAFERVRALDPSNPMAVVNLGTVELMTGRPHTARTYFEDALVLDPRVARAHNGLGVIAGQAGQQTDAIAHWRRAIELDPRDYQTLYNLGTLLLRLGRTTEARSYLERYVAVAPRVLEDRDLSRVRALLAR